MTWAELNAATAAHGLAVTGGAVSTTGIAGLTLGGGLGWLMAKYGLAADNLEAVELVTADGDVLDVQDTTHRDLFWALRGGGGNFGVAASSRTACIRCRRVTGGLIAHPIEAAPELLRFYRDASADASDDLTVFAGLVHAPDGSGAKLAALVVRHTGDPDQAARELGYAGGKSEPVAVTPQREYRAVVVELAADFDDYVREVRPRFQARRTLQRTIYRPGELVRSKGHRVSTCGPSGSISR